MAEEVLSGVAYTRAVSPRLAECELTHVDRNRIDADRAISQHAAYEAALANAGLTITRLPPLPDAPDGVFVEDTAIILGSRAVIARPGSKARATETASTASALATSLEVHELPVGTLDGGDVLRIERTLYVGLSARTDRAGVEALAAVVAPFDYEVVPVTVHGCLHLKTAATFAGHSHRGTPTLIINTDWVDHAAFRDVELLATDTSEPFAANTLRIGHRLFVAKGAARMREALDKRGFDVEELDISELQKAEAGLTCMSLIQPC